MAEIIAWKGVKSGTEESLKEDASASAAQEKKEASPLDLARKEYIEARRAVRGVWGAREKTQDALRKAGGTYEQLLLEERLKKIDAAVVDARAKGVSHEDMRGFLGREAMRYLEEEEKNWDALASEQEKGIFEKMSAQWHRRPGARMAIGFGLAGAGVLTGGVGILAARAAWSSFGAFMGAEGMIEKFNTRWGQKGLTEELYKKLTKGKVGQGDPNYFGAFDEIEKLSLQDVQKELARLKVLRDMKGTSLAHAGSLGVKTAGIIEALKRREQIDLAEKFKKQLGEKEKSDPIASRKAKGLILAAFLKDEAELMDSGIDIANDRERKNRIKRKAVAAGLGITVGVFLGTRGVHAMESAVPGDTGVTLESPVFEEKIKPWVPDEKMVHRVELRPPAKGLMPSLESHANPVAPDVEIAGRVSAKSGVFSERIMSAAGVKPFTVPEGLPTADDLPPHIKAHVGSLEAMTKTEGVIPPRIEESVAHAAAETKSTVVEHFTEKAEKGDSVWKMAERALGRHFNDFEGLNEAQKRYMIDAVKDKIAAQPGKFGLTNPDQIAIGQEIDFSKALEGSEEAMAQAKSLSKEVQESIMSYRHGVVAEMPTEHAAVPEQIPIHEQLPSTEHAGTSGEEFPNGEGMGEIDTSVIEQAREEVTALHEAEAITPGAPIELKGYRGWRVRHWVGLLKKAWGSIPEDKKWEEWLFSMKAEKVLGSRGALQEFITRFPTENGKPVSPNVAKHIAKIFHNLFEHLPKEALKDRSVNDVLLALQAKGKPLF